MAPAREAQPCEHFDGLTPTRAQGSTCAQCVALGAQWTELRVCMSCGHVGCCEDSKHAHALAHFQATGHPVIAPHHASEGWCWCYPHAKYYDLPPGLRQQPWWRRLFGA